jgi:hypothetical protein
MLRRRHWDFVDFDIREVVGVCCFRAWDGRKWTVVGLADTEQSESQLVVSGNAAKDVAGNKLVGSLGHGTRNTYFFGSSISIQRGNFSLRSLRPGVMIGSPNKPKPIATPVPL